MVFTYIMPEFMGSKYEYDYLLRKLIPAEVGGIARRHQKGYREYKLLKIFYRNTMRHNGFYGQRGKK